MDTPKVTLNDMLDAIAGRGRYAKDGKEQPSAGNMSLVAQRLGVSRATVYNYVNKYKKVAAAIHEQREATKDLVENKILGRIMEGSDTMIIFYAKTQMKDRGYIERVDHDLTSGGEKIKVTLTVDDDRD